MRNETQFTHRKHMVNVYSEELNHGHELTKMFPSGTVFSCDIKDHAGYKIWSIELGHSVADMKGRSIAFIDDRLKDDEEDEEDNEEE